MRYDTIVAGAGPAGSTAARECAQRGLSVLLLDRAQFPRDKPCGGGVNVRAARLLPFPITPVVERTITGMRVSVNQSMSFDRVSSDTLTYLTQRTRLDAYLVEKAVAAGAEMRERATVTAVDRHCQHITVRTSAGAFEGRALVVADGANGSTAKFAGIQVSRLMGIALEGNITTDPYPELWKNMLGIEVGSVPGGYGWLFPKGDHVNVGVGGWYELGPTLRSRLESLTRFYGFDPAMLTSVRGHPLPVRQAGSVLVDGNVLLVGDAAGLLDPLSGEGIFGAIWSGRSAALHLVSYLVGQVPDLEGYQRDLERDILPDLHTSGQLRDLFHVSPAGWAQLVRRSSRAWRVLCTLITGDDTYSAVRNRSRWVSSGIEAGSRGIRTLHWMRAHTRGGSPAAGSHRPLPPAQRSGLD